MIIIKRKMQVEEVAKTEESNSGRRCQASLNSDGRITLRHYDPIRKDNDEIIILSETETGAIFALMEALKNRSTRSLPF